MARTKSPVADELRTNLERTDQVDTNSQLQFRQLSTMAGIGVPLYLHLEDSTAYGLGETCVDVDREFRRALGVMSGATTRVSRSRQNVQLIAAQQTNSADLVLAAYHDLAAVILSNPLQLAISFQWLWDRRPTRWGITKPSIARTFAAISEDVIREAARATELGNVVSYSMDYEADGTMRIRFVAAPTEVPPSGPMAPSGD